ncbi:MAG: phosphatidate cytidylyltransferase [Clostridia bacterium]|nr:phosphatidate cytidylyltransferase [Clostridia bacterium]
MLKRIITGLVLIIVLFVPLCIFSGTPAYPIVVSLLGGIAVFEITRCTGLHRNIPVLCASVLFMLSEGLCSWFVPEQHRLIVMFTIFTVYLLFMLFVLVFSKGKIDFSVFASQFFGVFYVTLGFTCIVMIRLLNDHIYLPVLIGPMVTDISAYFVGKFLGRHKLIPEISPKKTVEGSVGAIIITVIAFGIYGAVTGEPAGLPVPGFVVMGIAGAIVSVVSQVGDLVMSAMKRKFGIKDFGNIFPGHGGLMDRVDSIIISVPFIYALAYFVFKG